MKKILIAAVSVLSLTLCSCSLIFNLSPLESESIGIIGGADGPTSIIVATPDKDETVTAKFPETTTVSPAEYDEWGILCYAEDVTTEGATINFEQYVKSPIKEHALLLCRLLGFPERSHGS